MNSAVENKTVDLEAIRKRIYTRFSLVPVFVGLTLILPAGTLLYWEAYAYLAAILVPAIIIISYFLKNDPTFLDRRSNFSEKEPAQKTIVLLSVPLYLAGFILPGLDYRFGWSDIPLVVVLVADLLVFLSYMYIFLVFRENVYAARVVVIEEGQKVISTGPYSMVRHPMYLGVIVMFTCTPIALGSWWAVIPFAIMPVILVYRILNEEKVLREQLPGYTDYCNKVRYRLIPFIW